jgi:hypothetical protein
MAGVFTAAAKPQPNNVHATRNKENPIFVMTAPHLSCCVETRAAGFKKSGMKLPAFAKFVQVRFVA